MSNTPYPTKAEARAWDQETFREIKQVTEAISAGEGGKIYKTVTEAENLTPKPLDNTIFQVEGMGYYAFDSSKDNGVRFVRSYFEKEEVTGTKISGKFIGTDGTITNISAGTSDVTDYIPVTEGEDIFYTGSSNPSSMVAVAGYDANKNYVETILPGGDYESQPITISSGVSYIVAGARNELYTPAVENLLKVEIKKETLKPEDLEPINIRLNSSESEISRLDVENQRIQENFEASKNLIDPEQVVNGYWNDSGSTSNSTSTIRSGLIPVVENQEYTLSGLPGLAPVPRVVFFSDSGHISNLERNQSTTHTFTTPPGTSKVGVNLGSIADISQSDIEIILASIMLEKGNVATNFDPFGVKIKQSAIPDTNIINKPKILIKGLSTTNFEVHSITERGDYLIHVFDKPTRHDQYDDGWYSPSIMHNENEILQGSFNWIHMIDNPNEDQHVGLGHGCETFQDVHWFADGDEFSPDDIVGQEIECNEFTFNWTSIIYAADSASTTSGEEVVPQIPLIPSTRHNLSGVIKPYNELECRNKLIILRNDTKFSRCYMAMLAGIYPYFDRVQYENIENTVNSMDSNGVVATPPSTALLNGYYIDTSDGKRAELAHAAKMWSTANNYKVTQEVYNLNNADQNKMHIQATSDGTTFRKKLYWHPIITTTAASRAGVPADVFNEGDVIEGIIKRKITL